jgi:hypothetical protein|tara:strand:- start:1715 stop:1927 length:213 start_codon:yes stop_codon:yes gene_type:complete
MEWMAAARHTPILTLISREKEEYGFSFHLFINTMIKLLLIILYKEIERWVAVKAAEITGLKCWYEFIVGM